jgi:hypothetical protein
MVCQAGRPAPAVASSSASVSCTTSLAIAPHKRAEPEARTPLLPSPPGATTHHAPNLVAPPRCSALAVRRFSVSRISSAASHHRRSTWASSPLADRAGLYALRRRLESDRSPTIPTSVASDLAAPSCSRRNRRRQLIQNPSVPLRHQPRWEPPCDPLDLLSPFCISPKPLAARNPADLMCHGQVSVHEEFLSVPSCRLKKIGSLCE